MEKNIPKRRFKEFIGSGEWEEKKLGEVANYRRGSFPQPYGKKEWYGGVGSKPFVQVVDVDSNLKLVDETKQKISIVAQPKSVFVIKGTVIVTLQGSIGRVAITQYNSYVDRTILIFESYNEKIAKKFWAYIIRKKFEEEKKSAPGATIKTITISALSNFIVNLPFLPEQKKIGNFFEKLDRLIDLNRKKLEKLKNIKSAYLSEMFPKEGELYPKRRFAGFTEPWEEKKLGEISNIVRGSSPRPIDDPKWFDEKSDTGWLRISDVTAQDGRIYHLEQHISKEGQEKTRVVVKPHLLISIAATVGKPVINYVKTGVHDGFLIFLDLKCNREFMFQWLEMYRPKWQKYGQPGSQVNLNSTIVRNQDIKLPSLEEQEKVGNFFKKLDERIILQEEKIEKLENMKKAYLSEMFV